MLFDATDWLVIESAMVAHANSLKGSMRGGESPAPKECRLGLPGTRGRVGHNDRGYLIALTDTGPGWRLTSIQLRALRSLCC
jgi:hypothetical protein